MKTVLLMGHALVLAVGCAVAYGDDGSARRYCDPCTDDTSRMFFLLGRREVQKDLALTTDQVGRLQRTAQKAPKDIPSFREFAASVKKLMADPMLSAPDRHKLVELYVTASASLISTYQRKELSQTLSAKQMQRLRELLIQMRGPMILIEDSALVRAVHLSDEQLAEMKETIKRDEAPLATFRRRMGRQMIAGLSAGETIQNREKEINLLCGVVRALESQRDYDLFSSLKHEQKSLWTRLSGSPLSIDWPLESPWQDPFHDKATGSENTPSAKRMTKEGSDEKKRSDLPPSNGGQGK